MTREQGKRQKFCAHFDLQMRSFKNELHAITLHNLHNVVHNRAV
jgi:hypothetical protein